MFLGFAELGTTFRNAVEHLPAWSNVLERFSYILEIGTWFSRTVLERTIFTVTMNFFFSLFGMPVTAMMCASTRYEMN